MSEKEQVLTASFNIHDAVVTIHEISPADDPIIRGTEFRVAPNVVVTAKHVVENYRECLVGTAPKSGGVIVTLAESIHMEPSGKADLAVLVLEEQDPPLDYLKIMPSHGYGMLGAPVSSYGYAAEKGGGFTQRFLVGHVQRSYKYPWHDNPDKRQERYEAYELSFPAFGGQSGSPICLREVPDPYRHRVVAIVTNSFPLFCAGPADGCLLGCWTGARSIFRLDRELPLGRIVATVDSSSRSSVPLCR